MFVFSFAFDESADICDVAQLSIFVRGLMIILKSLKNFLALSLSMEKQEDQTYLRKSSYV